MTLRLSRPTNSRVTRSPYWYCPLPLWSCRNTHCRQNPPGNLIWKVQIDFQFPSKKSWWSTWYHCQCWWIQTGGGRERRSQSDFSLNRRTQRLCRRAWRDINDNKGDLENLPKILTLNLELHQIIHHGIPWLHGILVFEPQILAPEVAVAENPKPRREKTDIFCLDRYE